MMRTTRTVTVQQYPRRDLLGFDAILLEDIMGVARIHVR